MSAQRRGFAPSPAFTLLTLAACALFVRLGLWQWHKGIARQAVWKQYARGAGALRELGVQPTTAVAIFQRVRVSGHLDASRQFLLDNRVHDGFAGYEVLTPLARPGLPALLIDRGWVPFPGTRARLPDVAFSAPATVTLTGRTAPLPTPGLALGRAPPQARAPWPKVTSFPSMNELAAAYGAALDAHLLLLDQGEPFGYVRDWHPPGIPPLRNLSYAFQWWGFAVLAVILWAVTNTVRIASAPRPGGMIAGTGSVAGAQPLRRAHAARTLALLAALFLLPLFIAFALYYGTAWRPAHLVNHGRLIRPPRALTLLALPRVSLAEQSAAARQTPVAGASPAVSAGASATRSPAADASTGAAAPFEGRWSLVYVGGGGCDRACREALYVMRETRLALGNDMARVARVFLVAGGCCAGDFLAGEHPGLLVLDATGVAAAPLLREFPAGRREHTLWIVDPLGNLMMRYDAREDPNGLLADLKKLLRLSHIG